MPLSLRSSRRRFLDYRKKLKDRRAKNKTQEPTTSEQTPEERRKSHKRSRSFFRLFAHFWQILRGHRRILILALIGISISTLIGLIPLYGTKIVFDNVLNDHPLSPKLQAWIHLPSDRRALLTAVAIAMVVLSAVSEIINLASRWQGTRITKRVQVSVRRQVFDHAVRLPLHRVYELKSGGVASILREDAGSIADLVFSMFFNPGRAIVQLIGCLVVLAWVDWRLLLGSLLLLPTVWLTHRTWISRIRPLFRDIRMTRQNVDAHATESFGGMRVVRSFSRQRYETGTFTANNHLMARQEILSWWWMRGIDFSWNILIPLSSALLLYYGGNRVLTDMAKVNAGQLAQKDAFTVGDLVMFLAYLANLLGPIATLANSATGLQNSLAALDRIQDLIGEPIEMPSKPGAINIVPATTRGRITFNHVSFSYPKSKDSATASQPGAERSDEPDDFSQVLHDITLDVHPGEMIALVGPSGAGKTTLCNLVARFYDPTAGSIALDGVDLRDITVESYRRLLGIVEQDTFLFDGTIADNIAYGIKNNPLSTRRGADTDQIIEAAKAANAHEFITKLPKGYDAVIGERGVKLSGGQRQRLTIARAILADPRILILDEATSNLDTESERLIQSSLHNLMHGRTTFAIAHRLSTIAHADRIVVLEAGRIVEAGSHDELMRSSTRYRDMVLLQTSPPPPPKHRPAEKPDLIPATAPTAD